ncbi:G:T/U mismatch-specific uracil/thymine DNA-glycosylase [Flavobacteriaceae bacterium 3519-10]|nr:G:T/U mismatch-specific uracil/thymine DNA-glycosylase [Flavobacteriaceae bacterium 3519-10]
MAERITSFPPIISDTSRILILGSAPGIKSLQMQQYYAHPQNQFWKILFHLFDEEYAVDYDIRKALLFKNHIALWDVIDSCEREGSSDAKIRNEEHNDVLQLVTDFPNITAIFSNGQKSSKEARKMLGAESQIPFHVLPSTSPLHTIPFNKKLEAWKILKHYL